MEPEAPALDLFGSGVDALVRFDFSDKGSTEPKWVWLQHAIL